MSSNRIVCSRQFLIIVDSSVLRRSVLPRFLRSPECTRWLQFYSDLQSCTSEPCGLRSGAILLLLACAECCHGILALHNGSPMLSFRALFYFSRSKNCSQDLGKGWPAVNTRYYSKMTVFSHLGVTHLKRGRSICFGKDAKLAGQLSQFLGSPAI